jgi:hypothetical protein
MSRKSCSTFSIPAWSNSLILSGSLLITWFHVMGKRSSAQIARKEGQAEFESECLGVCGARDTFPVGTLKGVGQVYRQPFVDTYAKAGFAKLHDRKTPIMAADLRNGRVLALPRGERRRTACSHRRGTE